MSVALDTLVDHKIKNFMQSGESWYNKNDLPNDVLHNVTLTKYSVESNSVLLEFEGEFNNPYKCDCFKIMQIFTNIKVDRDLGFGPIDNFCKLTILDKDITENIICQGTKDGYLYFRINSDDINYHIIHNHRNFPFKIELSLITQHTGTDFYVANQN